MSNCRELAHQFTLAYVLGNYDKAGALISGYLNIRGRSQLTGIYGHGQNEGEAREYFRKLKEMADIERLGGGVVSGDNRTDHYRAAATLEHAERYVRNGKTLEMGLLFYFVALQNSSLDSVTLYVTDQYAFDEFFS